MTENHAADGSGYQPKFMGLPPIYAWPPRPLSALRYLLFDLLYPWTFTFLVLAFPTWWYLTPTLKSVFYDP